MSIPKDWLDPENMAPRCNIALETNEPVRYRGLILIPDKFIAEHQPEWGELPETWSYQRSDGRSVYVFRDPTQEQ